MGSFNVLWMLCLLLMVRSKKEHSLPINSVHYFNIHSFDGAKSRTLCNPLEPGSHNYCDLQIKLNAECENCLAEPKILPNITKCYRNFQSVPRNDPEFLLVASTTAVMNLTLSVLDLDANCENPRIIFSSTIILKDYLFNQQSVIHRFDSIHGTFLVHQRKTCFNACGENCQRPDENFSCDFELAPICYNGYYHPSCVIFPRIFVWTVKLLNFQTDYKKLKMDRSCYEEASAYFSVSGYRTSSKTIGSTKFQNNSHLSLVLESKFELNLNLYKYQFHNESTLHLNLTTFCNGSKIASAESISAVFPLTKSGVFKLSKDGRLVFGVVNLCKDRTEHGYQCKYGFSNDFKKNWACALSRSAFTCAYETLCRNHVCKNGGICLLRRTFVDVNAYSHNQLVDTDPEDYTAECKCPEEYSGLHCEIVRRSILSSGEEPRRSILSSGEEQYQ